MFSNYADDNNLFSTIKDINKVKDALAKDFRIVSYLFYENFMVLNSKNVILCSGENETFSFKDDIAKTARKKLFWG